MKKIGIDARFCTDHATGIGRHVEELIKNLALLDQKTQYVCFMKPEIAKSFQVPSPNFTIEETSAPHYSLTEQISFLRQINRHKFDLMVFPQFNLPIFYQRKYVVTIHDLTLHFFPGKKKTGLLARLAYKIIIKSAVRKAQYIFAVSENTRTDLVDVLRVDPEKILVTYNGISKIFEPITDERLKQAFREKYKIPEKYFLYTGVLRTHKNVLGLLKAYAKFLQFYPTSEIDLVLTGPKDPVYWPEVRDLITELKLEEKVHHLGLVPHEEMNVLFSSCWAYVFPSFYEGFGIPPIEAMQCDVPVACANTASLPEACGKAALYFDPYSEDLMVEALDKIAFDEELRTKLITKGQTQCKKFSWEKMTKEMWDIYMKVI